MNRGRAAAWHRQDPALRADPHRQVSAGPREEGQERLLL
jgi:hypothetical protein